MLICIYQQNNFKPTKHDIHKHVNGRITLNQTTKIISQARKEGRKALLEPEAKIICSEYGIPVTKFKVASNQKEASKYADEIGYPVVLKIVSPDIIHKSDAGGVIVNLKTPDEVTIAYNKILENIKKYKAEAKIVGVLSARDGAKFNRGHRWSNQRSAVWANSDVWFRRNIC